MQHLCIEEYHHYFFYKLPVLYFVNQMIEKIVVLNHNPSFFSIMYNNILIVENCQKVFINK